MFRSTLSTFIVLAGVLRIPGPAIAAIEAVLPPVSQPTTQPTARPTDIALTVAADGSTRFRSISQALASLDPAGHDRVIVRIRQGVYREQVVISRSNVTLRGDDRASTRIEFATRDAEGKTLPNLPAPGVVNVLADDVVFDRLTIANTQPTRKHAHALYGRGTRTITTDCAFSSEGNDTVALWATGGGMYYHARCTFTGNIDFLCPRGWCYVTDSVFRENTDRAMLWHDGEKDPSKKLVLNNCSFASTQPTPLGRYPRDAQMYFVNCRLAPSISNVLDDDVGPEAECLWGRRIYFHNTRRSDGTSEPWLADTLATAAGHPTAQQLTPAWTFDQKWNPTETDPPRVTSIRTSEPFRMIELAFTESVTVVGSPSVMLPDNPPLRYAGGSGTTILRFGPLPAGASLPAALALQNGSIIASAAGTSVRTAVLDLPASGQH